MIPANKEEYICQVSWSEIQKHCQQFYLYSVYISSSSHYDVSQEAKGNQAVTRIS